MGAGDSRGQPGRASQAARLTSSATASSRRGGARVIKTDEATLFSGFEAIPSASGGAGDRVRRRLGQGSGHGRGGAEVLHLGTKTPPGQGASPLPTRQEQPLHSASAPPSHGRGCGCPTGKGRCPPGGLATGWDPAVLNTPPPDLHTWRSRGQPCPAHLTND